MDFPSFARAVFALALTLGLIGLATVALRRFGPDALARFARPNRTRRLAIVETLILDPTRRLVLVSCDGKEKLLMLGDGRVIDAAVAAPAKPALKKEPA